ncbi:MAG: hypothetical protein LC128_02235 [Chitinophagales bacterium]|nr:hypothetical protein [Chitinophagales bacterium]
MNNDFLQYIDRLVLLAFFSGYPLAYAIVSVLFNDKKIKQLRFPAVVRSFLPYSYALCGTLYLGLVLKDLYPSYSIETFVNFFDHSFLKIWALFSLLFWIPLFSKKPFIREYLNIWQKVISA